MNLSFYFNLTRSQKSKILLGFDTFWLIVSFFGAQSLILGEWPWHGDMANSLTYLAIVLPTALCFIVFFGVHRVKLNAYGMQGMVETAALAIVVGACALASSHLPYVRNVLTPLPVPVFVVFSMLFLILSVTGRLLLREIVLHIYRSVQNRKRVLIYGAGQTGQQLAAALLTDNEFEAIGFVDDNPVLQNLTIGGLRVDSPKNLRKLVEQLDVNRIVLAMPSASQHVRMRIAQDLRGLGCEVHAVPSFAEMVLRGDNAAQSVAPIAAASLLGRDGLEADLPVVNGTYQARRVLVTGAGGSIGSELCRQLLACNPSILVLLDHSELALYNMLRELTDLAPNLPIEPVLGSICQYDMMLDVIKRYQIDVIFHAAAYKHVPLVEDNSIEGLRNNVFGTRNVAEAARVLEVDRFILVSSDKAVRPTSIMGASKRLAELVVQDLATRSTKTCYSMVRFGNVLGSSGSVIPLFEDQIRRGGPVTVTHSDVTRYFMTVSEAVRLVLLAGSFARGGDVFVLDMGKPVIIRDLARKMIESAGYTVQDKNNPDGDIGIEITGLRPGEKMHEELLIGTEQPNTPHPKILRAQETGLSELEVANALQDLRRAIDARDADMARAVIRRWVEIGTRDESKNLINQ
ncbi:polysaccharide biosynthesis protein [Salinihabitans flavidus]|nr:nucleoside-diphosphate sugar epimerase/dehydratase [Salinihabitans flavidus]